MVLLAGCALVSQAFAQDYTPGDAMLVAPDFFQDTYAMTPGMFGPTLGPGSDAVTAAEERRLHPAWTRAGSRAGDEIVGPDGATLVWVPAGEFAMGEAASSDPAGSFSSMQPKHQVRITQGYWLGQCEVTNGQYRAFCEATGRKFPADSNGGDDQPVTFVSWDDAQAYCKHYGLSLPTEAEWEYGARGADGHKYPWGNHWKSQNLSYAGTKGLLRDAGSLPQGTSWCGARDMAGSVWEWCADWFSDGYYRKSPTDDPTGPASGQYRVLRGGSWRTDADLCRGAVRNAHNPTAKHDDDGFRCIARPGAS